VPSVYSVVNIQYLGDALMKILGAAITGLAIFLWSLNVAAMSDLLLIETDPMSSGMAGAGCGLPGNSSGYNINPAAPNVTGKFETGLNFSQWFGAVGIAVVHCQLPLAKKVNVGVNLIYRGLSFKETDGSGLQLNNDLGLKSTIENPYLSFEIIENLRLGLGLKIIQDYLQDYPTFFQGFDYGLLYEWKFLSCGVSVLNNNLGGKVIYQSQEEIINTTLRAGLGASLAGDRLKLAFDLLWGDDLGMRFKTGIEYVFGKIFILRAGYYGYDLANLSFVNGICAGFGFRWKNAGLDYSWFHGGDLNEENSFAGIKGISKIGVEYAF
jgi:hypothetical protein